MFLNRKPEPRETLFWSPKICHTIHCWYRVWIKGSDEEGKHVLNSAFLATEDSAIFFFTQTVPITAQDILFFLNLIFPLGHLFRIKLLQFGKRGWKVVYWVDITSFLNKACSNSFTAIQCAWKGLVCELLYCHSAEKFTSQHYYGNSRKKQLTKWL